MAPAAGTSRLRRWTCCKRRCWTTLRPWKTSTDQNTRISSKARCGISVRSSDGRPAPTGGTTTASRTRTTRMLAARSSNGSHRGKTRPCLTSHCRRPSCVPLRDTSARGWPSSRTDTLGRVVGVRHEGGGKARSSAVATAWRYGHLIAERVLGALVRVVRVDPVRRGRIAIVVDRQANGGPLVVGRSGGRTVLAGDPRSEEHTSELQSRENIV